MTIMNLITPKAGAKNELLFNELRWFVDHPSQNQVGQQIVTKIISMTIMNLETPKAGAKHELLFN